MSTLLPSNGIRTNSRSRFNSSLAAARMTNLQGVYDIHTNVMQWPSHMQPTHARWEVVDDRNGADVLEKNVKLPHLDPVYGRNFRIHDLCLESAPDSSLSKTGANDEGERLASIPVSILDELPTDCLRSFDEARAREASWYGKWHTERFDGLRAHFLPSVEWYPK